MQTPRLSGLADGIFAIVMTLLAFELHIPLMAIPSDSNIWLAIFGMYKIFFSIVLSFALLFTYWRAHHFLVSVLAKNLSVGLANWNALFFLLIIMVPFSAGLLGQYIDSRPAIIIYGANVIFIGMTLFFMRRYIENNPKIESEEVHKDDMISGYVRILFPVVMALIGISVASINPTISIILFAFGILFNLVPASTNIIHRMLVDSVTD